MKKVIIGAGPAGLYTAIKLWQEGIRKMVVYDPREGNYTRLGHLNDSVIVFAQKGLGINFWPANKVGHIKDLEKKLYAEAKKIGIKIEKKRFLRLQQDEKHPGIVVDNAGIEEFVEADYVFDCTGARREVISAVNHIVPESPLQLTTITELPVRNHFFAYVKINKSEWDRFEMEQNIINFPETIDAFSYVQSIIKLRALGWKEFKFPRIKGIEFGKNKVCLYIHAPDGLAKENFDNWVQTVLECYTKPISYQKLDSSSNQQFHTFSSKAQALKEVSYKGKNLPTVVALGDAQIDFDYYLGVGIENGIKRINSLFDHAVVFDNEIQYFDSAEYLQTINAQLRDHKEELIREAERVRQSFVDALERAELKFREVLRLSPDLDGLGIIRETLKEIEVRQSYVKATKLFAVYHNSSKHVVLANVDIEGKLTNIQTELLKVRTELPKSFATEHKEVEALLISLAVSWKEVGNALFKNKKSEQAIGAYKKALEIYNLTDFSGKYLLKELSLYSNLAVSYLQNKLYSEAITAAETALLVFNSCSPTERPEALQEKIAFNLIKALCAQAQELLNSSKTQDAESLYLRGTTIMGEYQSKFSSKVSLSLKAIMEELQSRLLKTEHDPNLKLEGKIEIVRSEEKAFSLNLTDTLESLGMFGQKTGDAYKENTKAQRGTPFFG